MAIMNPSREIISKMKPAPTDGEAYLLDFLERNLDDSWEIYFQSSLNGAFPDVILMHPNHGALIIEVKDWHLSLYSEDPENHKNWICHTADQGDQLVRSPLEQAQTYKNLFFDHYARSLASEKAKNTNRYALITAAVFFYNASKQEIQQFISQSDKTNDYIILLGRDDLINIEQFRSAIGDNYLFDIPSKYFTEEICNELRTVLRPSQKSIQKLKDINWTKDQKRLYNSYPGKKQKIRGEAGCGKTLTLAHRAIEAYRKTHSPVLILTYNITLRHYIYDTINQLRRRDPVFVNQQGFMDNFEIIHYHLLEIVFCNRYDVPFDKKNVKFKSPEDENIYRNKKMREVFRAHKGLYKTILVDEIQDYEKDWVDNINELTASDVELVFFGDEEQNIYKRDEVSEGNIHHRCYTGLRGNWSRIHGSHRVEGDIGYLAQAFQKQFFRDYLDNEIEPAMDDLFHTKPYLSYHYYENDEFDVEIIHQSLIEIMKKKKLHYDDICMLSNKVELLRKVDQLLRQKEAYQTVTTFELEEEYQMIRNKIEFKYSSDIYNPIVRDELKNKLYPIRRTSKMRFWMESGKIKLATIHSYKGWGIHTEILILDGRSDRNGTTEDDLNTENLLTPSLVYTGITRAKTNLIIFNIGAKKYHKFFQEHISDNHYIDAE